MSQSDHRIVTVMGRFIEQSSFEGLPIVRIPAPMRILVPKDCIAEVFNCEQGTEIRVRYSPSKSIEQSDIPAT